MTKEQILEITWEAIGNSNEGLFMEDDQTYEIAYCVVEMLSSAGVLKVDEQPEAITDGAHLRKHGVGRSAASDDTSTVKNDDSASSSETPVVGQNEQTKEVCLWCGDENIISVDLKLCRPCFDSVER